VSRGCHTYYHHIVMPIFLPFQMPEHGLYGKCLLFRCQNITNTLIILSEASSTLRPYVCTSATCSQSRADSYFNTSWNFGFSGGAIVPDSVSRLSTSTSPSLSLSFLSPCLLYMYLYQVTNTIYCYLSQIEPLPICG
jgi:hypothetical protein